MNAIQDAAANGFSLGVLIIGSLYWDAGERDAWRRECLLDVDNPHRVRVPIRYGRYSDGRKSYTMVFSPDLNEDRFGHAVAIQCKSQDIVEEAKRLWAAEKKKVGDYGVSASWGCVGLLPNPDSARLLSEPCQHWREFVRECGERSSNYRKLAKVDAGINEDGLLTIRWPKLLDGSTLAFDALLATATKPTSHDPQPSEIAGPWKTSPGKGDVHYFHNNRKNGIQTFQDDRIAPLLAESAAAD